MAIVVPIAADFDASGVKAAQQSFAQFGQTLTKTLQQAGKDARKSFGDIERGANDSSTAAERLARSISAAAERLDTDLKASKAAADALGRSLGPELAAKLGQSGLNKLVTDLNRAGVSIEEITAEADVLAAAIKQVDDVQLSNVAAETDKLNGALKTTAANADRSRGVMANFVGNAAQEIPGVTGAMGPLNVAIGQFAEYATEGGINFQGIVKAVGPIAVLSAGLFVVQGILKANAAETKYWADNATIVRDALKDLENPLDVIAQKNKEAGSIKVYDPNKGIFGGTREITDDLDKLGLTQNDLTAILKNGKGAIEQWADTVEGSRKPLRRWSLDRDEATSAALVYKYLNDQLKANADGAEQATTEERIFGDVLTQTATAATGVGMAAGFAQVAIDRKTAADLAAKTAADLAAEADRNHANAIDSVREALYKRNNARYASEDADANARDAIEAYNDAQEQANRTGNSSDIEKANELRREAERAFNGAAAAASGAAEEQYQFADETTRAAAATAAGVQKLKDLKNILDPGGELSQTVLTWILLLDKIPKEVTTRFGISFGATPKPTQSSSSASSIMDTFTNNNVFDNSGRPTSVTNITVNGAVDAVATANQIKTIQDRNNQRNGTD